MNTKQQNNNMKNSKTDAIDLLILAVFITILCIYF